MLAKRSSLDSALKFHPATQSDAMRYGSVLTRGTKLKMSRQSERNGRSHKSSVAEAAFPVEVKLTELEPELKKEILKRFAVAESDAISMLTQGARWIARGVRLKDQELIDHGFEMVAKIAKQNSYSESNELAKAMLEHRAKYSV